jgi:hypothetical protein
MLVQAMMQAMNDNGVYDSPYGILNLQKAI